MKEGTVCALCCTGQERDFTGENVSYDQHGFLSWVGGGPPVVFGLCDQCLDDVRGSFQRQWHDGLPHYVTDEEVYELHVSCLRYWRAVRLHTCQRSELEP